MQKLLNEALLQCIIIYQRKKVMILMNLDNSKINQAQVAKKIALLLKFVVENLTFQVTINISNDKTKFPLYFICNFGKVNY